MFGPGMRQNRPRRVDPRRSVFGESEYVFFSPHVSTIDADGATVFPRWEDVIGHIRATLGRGPLTAAVFPCGPMQMAYSAPRVQ